MKKNFTIKTKVWRWPGDGGWHFVTLDKKLSQDIRKVFTKGFVKIRAEIGDSAWDTSLFPHKESGYLLCINKKIRSKEGIFEGDDVNIKVKIL
ncbi:DUF1905 domain-containing protein [Candidatus Nomurabacteria bacterium]|nr:MAG: DUF1905 domain-containing protein [Candidatus Nomurabacteria bacterium]